MCVSGEGNGNPLQYSCLENPIDRGAPVGCCPWGHTESDTTEATLHACIGGGNGNPLQYSSLENPRDRGAWWTAVYGVAQSQTRLKWLSSSNSSSSSNLNILKSSLAALCLCTSFSKKRKYNISCTFLSPCVQAFLTQLWAPPLPYASHTVSVGLSFMARPSSAYHMFSCAWGDWHRLTLCLVL